MFELKLDLREFERKARDLQAAQDQVPFALSLALNQAAKNARQALIQGTWPRHVTVRNTGFLQAALRVTQWATKNNLRVEVADVLKRGNLMLHAKGGTKHPRGAHLAIPISANVSRTSKGVRASQRPRTLTSRPDVFVARDGIYMKQRGGRLKKMYSLKTSAQQPKDVPFIEDFADVMRREMRANFGPAMMRAMRTRR